MKIHQDDQLDIDTLSCFLDIDSPLAKIIPSFEKRLDQKEMVKQIATAFNTHKHALIEAPTGIGKSLCYLLCAMLHIKHFDTTIVISTHTLNLQDQLIKKEIPILQQALDFDLPIEIAKGMNNFFCLRKFHDLDPHTEAHETLEHFMTTTQTGDTNALHVSDTIKHKIACEQEACEQKRCPFFKECFFFQNKKRVQKARLIITNHHLLLLDLKHKFLEEKSAILPVFEHLILDEAHHLEDVATKVFSKHLDRKKCLQIVKLSSKQSLFTHLEKKLVHLDPKENLDRIQMHIKPLFLKLQEAIFDLFDALKEHVHNQPPRITKKTFFAPVDSMITHTLTLTETLTTQLDHLIQDIKTLDKNIDVTDFLAQKEDLEHLQEDIEHLLEPDLNDDSVYFFEKHPLCFYSAPKQIAPLLQRLLFEKMESVILCSATLSTNQNFDFFKTQLGLDSYEPIECQYPPCFDFKNQVFLAIPNPHPQPNEHAFLERSIDLVWQTVKHTQGKTFILFTSFEMLHRFYDKMEETNTDFILLKQGDLPKPKLLEAFEAEEKTILFGTDSFWEGVDTKGHMQSLIITKLPFKVPTHPLFEARQESFLNEGKDPFLELAIPKAIVKFKQGFGRLIRSRQDRGIVLILDNRLLKKSYGQMFLHSLPECHTCFENQEILLQKMKEWSVTGSNR